MKGKRQSRKLYVGSTIRRKRGVSFGERLVAGVGKPFRLFWQVFGVSSSGAVRRKTRQPTLYHAKSWHKPQPRVKEKRGPTVLELLLWLAMLIVAGAFLLLLAQQSPLLAMIIFVALLVVAWWGIALRR